MSQTQKSLAIAGVTGAVGREYLKILENLDFPLKSLKLLASKRSAGNKISFRGEELVIEEMTEKSFAGIDIALFSAGSAISKKFLPYVREAGAVMVDNSSAFRMDKDTPLVIPEINPQDVKNHNGVIANPNCSTIIMLMPIFPLHQKYPIKKIVVSTYQAASGGGWEAMEELRLATQAYLKGEKFSPNVLPHPYGFNLFSHNSAIDEKGYNEEEMKMVQETHKILHNSNIAVSPTCVRVPVLRAHSESIYIEFEKQKPTEAEARELMAKFPGLRVIDDREKNYFPMPIDASEQYDCLVGRVRDDLANPLALNLFVAGDQLLKGAALNSVQIAQLL